MNKSLAFSFLVVGAISMSSTSAHAQPGLTPPGQAQPNYGAAPYYGPPMQPMPQRTGRTGYHIGISGGLGILESDAGEFVCDGCEPIAGTFDIHVGTMLTPKFALQGEYWLQSQSIDAEGRASIRQDMFMVAGQYWITPRFWAKGGIGAAVFTLNWDDSYDTQTETLGSGLALQFALGYELIHSRTFSLDAQLKMGSGNYEDRDEQVSASSLALGVNWY